IAGLDDGVLPHKRSFEDAEEMAEERRLMYVGLTRAKDRLILTRAFRRTTYGDFSVSTPSRFLEDIPAHLVSGHFAKKKSDEGSTYKRETTWESPLRRGEPLRSPPSRVAADSEGRYRSGQRVKHPQFGDGMVIESKGGGDDEIVIVAFEQTGIKRLAANVAELKILKG
ncbi:MAG: 3'-5' exonuclease, partial [Chloroflexota bacterium]